LTVRRIRALGSSFSGRFIIDIGADKIWDYVVDLTSWAVAGANNPDAGEGRYDIYSVDLALNDSSGIFFPALTGPVTGAVIR